MKNSKIYCVLFVLTFHLLISQTSVYTQEVQSPPQRTVCPIEMRGNDCGYEKANLDSLAIMIQESSDSKGYIFYYGGKHGKQNEALARATRMKAYLVQERGIETDRLILVDGGFREELMVEFYIAPFGAEQLEVRPTVDVKDVTFEGVAEIVNEPCTTKKVIDDSLEVTTQIEADVCGYEVCKLYDFGELDIWDEKAQLDAFAIELINDPMKKGLIVVYQSKTKKRNKGKIPISAVKYYLTKNRDVPADRIEVIDGGYREYRYFKMWFVSGEKVTPKLSLTYQQNGEKIETASQTRAEKIHDYDIRSYDDDLAQLDAFAIYLQNHATASGYVIVYGGKLGRRNEAKVRLVCMRDYLIKNHGIEASRLFFIDGGYREKFHVEMWFVPKGEEPPKPTPTVSPKDVKFKGTVKVKKHCDSGI